MNDRPIRCISLVLIFMQYLLLFLFLLIFYLPMMVGVLTQPGSKPAPELICFVVLYLTGGALMICSVFYKAAYHILTACHLVLLALAFWGQLLWFRPSVILPIVLFLLPQLLYYFAIIQARRQAKCRGK